MAILAPILVIARMPGPHDALPILLARMVADILSHIGREGCTTIDPAIVQQVKPALIRILQEECPTHRNQPSTEQIVIDSDFMDLWRTASKDPDTGPRCG